MSDKKYLIALLILAISISAAGCTASQASTQDKYGTYLSEMSGGNAEFSLASDHYNNASKYFSNSRYSLALQEIKEAKKGYNQALAHYQNMTPSANNEDQRAYADALQAYARSCMYASGSYSDAYLAFSNGDNYKGNACLKEAKEYIEQANKDHARAVALQPNAIV
jgi:tetratricopeptide (TPR) repeat protein